MPLRYVARLPLQAAIAAAALAEQEERERERERERRAMRLAPSLAGAPHELLQQISLQALAHSSLTARVSSEGGEGEAVSGHHPSGHRLGGSRTGGLRRDLQPVLHSCMSHPNCAASDHVFAAVDSDASRRLAARRPRPARVAHRHWCWRRRAGALGSATAAAGGGGRGCCRHGRAGRGLPAAARGPC